MSFQYFIRMIHAKDLMHSCCLNLFCEKYRQSEKAHENRTPPRARLGSETCGPMNNGLIRFHCFLICESFFSLQITMLTHTLKRRFKVILH